MASMMVQLATVGADLGLERFQLVPGDVKVSLFKRAYGTTFIYLNERVTAMDLGFDAVIAILPFLFTAMLATPQRLSRPSSKRIIITFYTAVPAGRA